MSICKTARAAQRAHKAGDITTEDALHILVSLYNDTHATAFTDEYVSRAITLVTGIPIVKTITIKE